MTQQLHKTANYHKIKKQAYNAVVPIIYGT